VAEELDGGGGYSAGSVYLGVGLDLDQIDKDALAIPAKVQAIKDIRIPVKLCADEDHFRRSVDDLRRIKIDCIPIRFCLDEDALYGDLARIRRNVAENPIKVGFDTSAISFVRAEVESLRRETVDLKGSFSFDTASVRAELESVRSLADEIAATPRRIYYAAEVQPVDIAALQQSLKAEAKLAVNVDELRKAAPDVGKAIAEEIGKSKVTLDQGGFASRIIFGGLSNIVRGFQESIGKEIFQGTSKRGKAQLQGIGGVVENVSGAVGTVVRDRALQGAGFAGVKDFEQAFKGLKLENLLIAPLKAATEQARRASVLAASEGQSAAKTYFDVFRKTLVSEVKASKDIKDTGLGAVGRVTGAAVNIAAPIQDFRRDVAIEKAKKQAESIEIEFTPEEIESILNAKKQILVGNAGFYASREGNLGEGILGGPLRRFAGQEFVGVENPSSTRFLRGEELPGPLKSVIKEEKTLQFFRALAKTANKLELEVPRILEEINDPADLENAILTGVSQSKGDLRRLYLAAIENTFGAGINADLPQQIAKVNAIKKLRPDLEVKAVGFSGGGYVADQLARATGIKAVALGTPFFRPPAAISGRGELDSIYDSYGKNNIIRNQQGPQFQDLAGVGAGHAPAKYFGKENLRGFLNSSLELGLSNQQVKTQGVDFRSIGDINKNIQRITKELTEISIAAGGVRDAARFVGSIDFSELSTDQIQEALTALFRGIESNIEGFEKAIGDPSLDEPRDRLTGITEHYRSILEKMVERPSEIASKFEEYSKSFSEIASQATRIRASDIPGIEPNGPEQPLPKKRYQRVPVIPDRKLSSADLESVALVEAIHSVAVEIAKADKPAIGLAQKLRKAEQVTADLLTGGRGAETKQALQLFAQNKLSTAGSAVLQGGFSALRGGYGLAKGVEDGVLGLAPFGLGYGAKRVAQAGAGFAALNSVGAGELTLSAGSHLGSSFGVEMGQAFTAYLSAHLSALFQPVASGIGGAITSLLQVGGATAGAGAAALGAGATTFAVGEKTLGAGLKAIAPQPLQLAFKEAKSFELIGAAVTEKATKAIAIGAQQKATAYLTPPVSVNAEISPITDAFNALPQRQYAALPESKDQFKSVTPRPRLGASPTGLSSSGAIAQANQLITDSQKTRKEFLALINDPALKSGRIDLLYNATVQAQLLIEKAQRSKDALRQLAYENKGTTAQQKIIGSSGPIVQNAKEAQQTLSALVKQYEKSGRDIGVFIQKGLAAGLSQKESENAATKLVAVIQQTIESGFEIASPSKWAYRAGQFIQAGLSLGLESGQAVKASEALADSVIRATQQRFDGKFKSIGESFAGGLTKGRSPEIKALDRQVITNQPKYLAESTIEYQQRLVRKNPPQLETQIRANQDLTKSLNQVVRSNPPKIEASSVPKDSTPKVALDSAAKDIVSQGNIFRRAGQGVVKGLVSGLAPETAIAAANNLADGIVSATAKSFSGKFRRIAEPFVLGIQDEIVSAQTRLIGGRRIAIKPFEGIDNAIELGASATIAEIRAAGEKMGVEFAKTENSLYEQTNRGTRKKLNGFNFTPFEGNDNAVPFSGSTRISQLLADAKRQGIEYQKEVRRFDLVGTDAGQTPNFKQRRFTQFQGQDDRIPFNSESRIGDVVSKAKRQGLYGSVEQSPFELTEGGVTKRRFTQPSSDVEAPLEQSLSRVRKSRQQLQEEAFAAGRGYGEKLGVGIKSGGAVVGEAAKEVGRLLPEGLKSGSGQAIAAFKGFFSGLKTQLDQARADLPLFDKIAGGVKGIAIAAGAGFIGVSIFQQIQAQAGEAYQAIKQLESARTIVKATTGSTKALDLANVQADRTGARLDESRTAIKSLSIQAQNTPLESKVGDIFKGASTTASALQLNQEQQSRLYLAINQILGKGTVQSEELKQQLGELGVSFQLASRAAGLSPQQFSKQLEQGAVLSTDFAPKFARQLVLEQSGLALKAADTPQGLENKLSNSKLLLQEAVGEQSLPLITAGMKALNGILELVTNNIGVLTTAINVGLIAALAKGASVIKEYAFAEQFRRNISLDGTVNEKVSIGSRAGRAVTGAADFVKGGGIQRTLTSEPAKEIAKAAGEALLFAGALASVSKVSETIFGGKDLQDYNKQLEITRIRLEEINKVYDKTDSSIKNFGDRSRTAGNEALAVLGNLAKLDFGGAIDSFSRGLVAIDGGDPNATFGRNESQFGLTTRQQADNSRILLSGLDTINSGKFNDEFAKGSTLATKLRKGLQVVDKTNAEIEKDPALNDKLKKGLIVSQEDLSKSRESLQTYREQLASIPEAILKSPEGQPLREEIKQLDKLIKNLGGEGSAYAKLTVAAQKYADITQKQIELEKTQAALISSRGRASGQTTEFQSKLDDIAAQSDAAAKNKAAIADLLQKSDAFLAGSEFSALRLQDPLKAQAKQQENIEYKTQYAAADKQIEDGITQVRLENVNRRSELFQREVAAQERLTARREGRQRLVTTGRDANLALGASRFEITPQQLRIRQIQAQEDDATFAFREGYKKRADAVKNLKQAQFDLSRINPNDEQQYEAGKAAVAQYQQAVLAAGAEINAQQKAYSDAQLARIQEEQSQVSTLIDQTVRKAEQQADRRIKANDRLTAALKRQTDNQAAGLERVNKLVGKQNELTQAQANLAQIRGSGRLSGLKAAGDLAQQVKDLDPNKKEETAQDRAKKRDRLGSILDRIGLGRDPERIFQKEVTAANDLAKVKARALNAEIRGAEITLAIEQRKEKIARERAVREALAAQRSAQLGVDRSSVGVRAAEARLNLAKLSGDPNKVIEAQLTLDQAKLDFEAAASELPNSANAVNEALFDLANLIRESALQRELGQVSAETKRSQFGLEERDRVTSTQVEAANKGFNFGRTRVQDQSGLVPLRGITLRNDPIYRSGVKESRFEAAEERSIARQRPENLQFNDRANNIKTFASYGLNLRPGESLGNLAKFNGVGAPSVAPPDLSRLLQTPSFSASTPTQNEQVTFDPSGQIVEALNRQLQIVQAMNAKLAGLLQKELTATVQVNGTSSNDDVQIRGGR
jgi:tape measure domain-containing protein